MFQENIYSVYFDEATGKEGGVSSSEAIVFLLISIWFPLWPRIKIAALRGYSHPQQFRNMRAHGENETTDLTNNNRCIIEKQ